MTAETPLDPRGAASLIGWWLDMGVDATIGENPREWRQKTPNSPQLPPSSTSLSTSSTAASPVLAPAPPIRPRAATLEQFHEWLRETSDLPLFRAGASRALPHGPAEARLMLVSDLPASDSAAQGRPIGGAEWELTVKMLAAIGIEADQAYVASLACFPALGSRIEDEAMVQCAETMREHISLVAPKRLLLLGDGPSKALLGQPVASARGKVHRIGGVPTVATFHPRYLLTRPSDKSYAWRDLLLMMSEEVS